MSTIDEYANSMFRFEYLHESWIEACTRYVQFVFGGRIRDRVVLDYAFGRGNWSVAFRRAGARQVISIDASESNVRRFREYCVANRVDGIDVRLGNFFESRQEITADIVWIYGILQHLADPDLFIALVRDCARDDRSAFFFYAYDRGSLREAIVENCRRSIVYTDEASFDRDSLVLTPKARLRGRDDLTAAFVHWWSAEELQAMLRRHGIYVEEQPRSFDEFLGRPANEEFRPHHFLCSRSAKREIVAEEPSRRYREDARLIDEWIRMLWSVLDDREERGRAALGIMNTHFSALAGRDGAAEAIVDDFLFIFNLLVRRDAADAHASVESRELYRLAIAALRNESRAASDFPELAGLGSTLVEHLLHHNVRI